MNNGSYKTWTIIEGDYKRSPKDDYEEQMKGMMNRQQSIIKTLTTASIGLSVALLLVLLRLVSGGN